MIWQQLRQSEEDTKLTGSEASMSEEFDDFEDEDVCEHGIGFDEECSECDELDDEEEE